MQIYIYIHIYIYIMHIIIINRYCHFGSRGLFGLLRFSGGAVLFLTLEFGQRRVQACDTARLCSFAHCTMAETPTERDATRRRVGNAPTSRPASDVDLSDASSARAPAHPLGDRMLVEPASIPVPSDGEDDLVRGPDTPGRASGGFVRLGGDAPASLGPRQTPRPAEGQARPHMPPPATAPARSVLLVPKSHDRKISQCVPPRRLPPLQPGEGRRDGGSRWRPRMEPEFESPFPEDAETQTAGNAQDADDIDALNALEPDEIEEINQWRKKRDAAMDRFIKAGRALEKTMKELPAALDRPLAILQDEARYHATEKGSESHLRELLTKIWDPNSPGQPVPEQLPKRKEGEAYADYMDRVETARKAAQDAGRKRTREEQVKDLEKRWRASHNAGTHHKFDFDAIQRLCQRSVKAKELWAACKSRTQESSEPWAFAQAEVPIGIFKQYVMAAQKIRALARETSSTQDELRRVVSAAVHTVAEIRDTIVIDAAPRAKALFAPGKILNDNELAILESIASAGTREEATLRLAASVRAQSIWNGGKQWREDLGSYIGNFRNGDPTDAQRRTQGADGTGAPALPSTWSELLSALPKFSWNQCAAALKHYR